MADDYNMYAPSATSDIAGFAQGAQAFTQSFMQARQQAQQMDLQRQQMESQRQLQQMQMMKLQKELMPTQMDLGKVQLITQMHNTDPEKYQGLLNTYLKKTVDNIQTPLQLQYAQAMAQKSTAEKDQSNQVFNSFGISPPVQPNPSTIPVTKDELALAEKTIGYDTSASIAGGRNQTALTVEQMKSLLQQQGYDIQRANNRDNNQTKLEAARIKAAASGKNATSLDDKVALGQLNNLDRRIEDSGKKLQPDAFSAMLDDKAQVNAYQTHVANLKAKERYILSNPKLRAMFPNISADTQSQIAEHAQNLGIAPPSGPAPMSPAAPVAPAAGVSAPAGGQIPPGIVKLKSGGYGKLVYGADGKPVGAKALSPVEIKSLGL